MRRFWVVLVVSMFVASATAPASAEEGSRFREAVRTNRGVIATESPAASKIGLEILDDGGNAVDAAVAMVFAVTAARPQSCGIGGGGFMVYRSAKGKRATLDFRETAPAAIKPDQFAGPGIHQQFTGHMTVGVPGVVAGMSTALKRYGTLSLAEAIDPARELAAEGVTVTPALSEAMAANAERLKMFPAAADQFLVGGQVPYPAGSTLVQEDLAKTLRQMQREGIRSFYRGKTAALIVEDMENTPNYPGDDGLITKKDLAGYRAKWRDPLLGTYRDHQIIAMPPPTSGGIATLEILNILEGYDLASFGQSSADHIHFTAEAQKIAWADRAAYVADSDFVDVPTDVLISKRYAARRRTEIDPDRAKTYPPGDVNGVSTTHISVIDGEDNAVALTCTIEQEFGSAVVAPGTGFLLNNELTDFGAPDTANEPEPGKRPRSSMSPTIVVKKGEPVLVVGGAGGARIIMGSVLAISNLVDFKLDIAHAVDAERFDAAAWAAGRLGIEDARVAPEVLLVLESRGHVLLRSGEYAPRPRVNAAGTDLATGEHLAVSDPRTEWAALAQRRCGGRRGCH